MLLVDISAQIENLIMLVFLPLEFTLTWLGYETKSNSTRMLKNWVKKPLVDWNEQAD